MRKWLLLILFVFQLLIPLYGQKKAGQTKPTHTTQPVRRATAAKQEKTVSLARPVIPGSISLISPGRNLRLAQRKEAQESVVVLKNENHFLPLNRLDTLKTLVISIGFGKNSPVCQMIGRYIKSDQLTITQETRLDDLRHYLTKSSPYNLVILAVAEQNQTLSNGLSVNKIEELTGSDFPSVKKKIYLLFGSHPFLQHWTESDKATAMVVSAKEDYDRLDLASQLIFGAISANARLPFDLNRFRQGEGVSFGAIDRLSYVLPEELGIDSIVLARTMDTIVNVGLREKAYPGCQMLLAIRGKVFYQKSYGFHTYDHSRPVQNDDIYDLASVTKVLAPVPALMMLADQKKFLVNRKMSEYWPDWKGSNKEGILVSDVLSHQARLRPGVTLWPLTLDPGGRYKAEYYSSKPAPGYGLCVAHNLYLINSYPDTIYKVIRKSPLLRTKKYAYSDLGFVLFPKVIENLTGVSFESFLQKNLYEKLGTATLVYNPHLTVPLEKIVPTEDDKTFRHELLQGYVHDETAALMGGISGNAGLFGSAGDVAKVMQLYIQNGTYGNEKFIDPETVKNWTSSHFQKTNNRRGFGFDKPAIQSDGYAGKKKYPSSVVSEQSYGHSGFTGTFVWADPVNDLLFVFLSNRVCPNRENHKINRLRIRTLLLETLFRIAGDK